MKKLISILITTSIILSFILGFKVVFFNNYYLSNQYKTYPISDGLAYSFNKEKINLDLTKNKEDLTEQFVKLYSLANILYANYNLDNYYNLMQYYLNLALSIDMDNTDIINSYLKKLDVNHNRQKNNY